TWNYRRASLIGGRIGPLFFSSGQSGLAGLDQTSSGDPGSGQNDPRCQAKLGQKSYDLPRQIEFPPFVAVPRRTGIGVVIVVPSFARSEKADDRVVAAIVVGGVISITPNVSHRVDGPRRVPDQHGAQRAAPDKKAASEPARGRRGLPHRGGGDNSGAEKTQP